MSTTWRTNKQFLTVSANLNIFLLLKVTMDELSSAMKDIQPTASVPVSIASLIKHRGELTMKTDKQEQNMKVESNAGKGMNIQ